MINGPRRSELGDVLRLVHQDPLLDSSDLEARNLKGMALVLVRPYDFVPHAAGADVEMSLAHAAEMDVRHGKARFGALGGVGRIGGRRPLLRRSPVSNSGSP